MKINIIFWVYFLLALIVGCQSSNELTNDQPLMQKDSAVVEPSFMDSVAFIIEVKEHITVKEYFDYLDSLVFHYDTLVPYSLSEHLLVQANSWIIDTLVNTDYYVQQEKGEFIYNQQDCIILQVGDSLFVPAENLAYQLINRQQNTRLDINIPEFKLFILIDDQVKYSIPIRVGQNRKRFLLTANRVENLRTRTGEGTIYKVTRDPIYMNPVNGHRYFTTLRDDNQRTKLPRIPFLHPEINGHRWGQLIHPTTNPETLGKAYSNGCIGTGEGDAWRIYYHAPVGTKISIRYDLLAVNDKDTIRLKDIYGTNK